MSGPLDFATWRRYVRKWQGAGNEIPKLIESESLSNPPSDCKEGDIYDYGVERILIVERDILVDWLVLNDFHAQERTLVLSVSGYPDYLVPIARELIEQNANLPVCLLHDSTARGLLMNSHLVGSSLNTP